MSEINWRRWPEEKPETDRRFIIATVSDDGCIDVDTVTMTYLIEQYGVPRKGTWFFWIYESDLIATLPEEE